MCVVAKRTGPLIKNQYCRVETSKVIELTEDE